MTLTTKRKKKPSVERNSRINNKSLNVNLKNLKLRCILSRYRETNQTNQTNQRKLRKKQKKNNKKKVHKYHKCIIQKCTMSLYRAFGVFIDLIRSSLIIHKYTLCTCVPKKRERRHSIGAFADVTGKNIFHR